MFPESIDFVYLQRETDFIGFICVVTGRVAELENGSGGAQILIALVEPTGSMSS